ncbi:MAG: hypothetical protein CL933_09085 [Deltaproteobacteria bacterium]|nr:hypothetical protein [Deltaproteobacteria bacterium]
MRVRWAALRGLDRANERGRRFYESPRARNTLASDRPSESTGAREPHGESQSNEGRDRCDASRMTAETARAGRLCRRP